MMTITTPTIVVKHSSNQGVVAGIVGSVLAVFGIFTRGLIFVPLAAICTLVALVRGITGKSAAGIGCSLLAGALTFWGVVVSPSIWIVVGAGLLAAHSPSHPATVSASTASGATFGTSLQPVQPVAPAPPRAPVISKGSADALEKQANAIANAAMMECRN